MIAVDPDFDWREIARLCLTSRFLDELEEQELAPRGYINYQFSARGHELGQVLISQILTRPFDAATVYYRSRPFALGSGLTLVEALGSQMARAGGMSNGRDVGATFNMPRRGKAAILPMAGEVGSGYTPAAGWAQALQYRRDQLGETRVADGIAVTFGGEGSVATNGFWSGLTIATTLKLPLLFVIEDNGYAISVPGSAQTPGGNIAENLASFKNLRIWSGSGTYPPETAHLVMEAVQYVRSWHGPALLRMTVPRLSGHTRIDNQAYKSRQVLEEEWSRDPIRLLRDFLVPATYSRYDWESLVKEVQAHVRDAAGQASALALPEPETIRRYVFAEPGESQQVGGLAAEGIVPYPGSDTPGPDSPVRMNFVDAIRRTLDHELSANPRLIVFGEDVGEKGGVHASTMGLMQKHGAARVFDTSLSEEGIIGRAVGMAYAGLLPVPEIQFRKYADPAMEQIHNTGTIRWRTHNRFAAPMVIRMPGGFRRIGDPWHSMSNEIIFAHAVGWKLAFPSNADDGVGLLRTALRCGDPVIFFEHRAVLDSSWARRPYPGDDYAIPFGQARLILEGSDLTVITWGAMVERCEAAARETGASVEIIDLRTIVPWDKKSVLESVRKNAKCLIVHEDIQLGGFGAEIAATLADEAFMHLDGPIQRFAVPGVPIPYSTLLMDAVVPTISQIKQKMEHLLAY